MIMRRFFSAVGLATIVLLGATAPSMAVKPGPDVPKLAVVSVSATSDPATCAVLLGWSIPEPKRGYIEGFSLSQTDSEDQSPNTGWPQIISGNTTQTTVTIPNGASQWFHVKAEYIVKVKGDVVGSTSPWSEALGGVWSC